MEGILGINHFTDRTDSVSAPYSLFPLLTFHSNHGPISYRFRDKRRFQSKSKNFPLRVFCAAAEGVPLELGTGAGGKLE